ncbi:MAG: Fe-S-cluster containining protein [Alphaproteobacteria bacterium]|jgi:Fe-S-cluster containining protein
MERRFSCTACGKCCHGQVPLTIADALAHADKFPLAIVWSTVRKGGRSFQTTGELGVTIQVKKKMQAAVRVAPTAYIPPGFPCPELMEGGLCGIHDSKPQRCRTMPFSVYRDEADQDDLMLARPGWLCDTSDAAPVYYRDKVIVERGEFDVEQAQLSHDATILKPYGDWLIASAPALGVQLRKAALAPRGGQVVTAFSTLIPKLPKVDIYEIAALQAPVMQAFAKRTADDPALKKFHRHYVDQGAAWERVLSSRPARRETTGSTSE